VDEKELIERSRRGDLAAFELLVREKRNQVFRIARQIVGEDDGAKDVAQMVFIRLWETLGRYREGGSFNAYLHRITVNLAIDFVRRQARSEPAERMSPEALDRIAAVSPTGGEPSPGEIQRIFRRLAGRLSPKQRAAFVLREIEGMSTEEVAAILGTSDSTVRNHVHAARQVLQDGLRRFYPEYFPESKEKES
jgi:RNA polymerase sigma-70 factor, ECF subfamily